MSESKHQAYNPKKAEVDKPILVTKYRNEFDAFTTYFSAVSRNTDINLLTTFIEDCQGLNVPCTLNEKANKKSHEFNTNLKAPKFISSENAQLKFATKKVDKKDIPEKGYGIIANTKINRNEIIINESPTILQVNPIFGCIDKEDIAYHIYRCHHCAKAVTKFISCTTCTVIVFCSTLCYESSYNDYHKYECFGLKHHFWSMQATDYMYLAMRMMLYGAKRNFFVCMDTGGDYHTMYQMSTSFWKCSVREVNNVLYDVSRTVVYLIQKTQFFSDFQNKLNLRLYNSYLYVGGVMVRHYFQAQTQAILLNFMVPNIRLTQGQGKAICHNVNLLNHSCTPNAVLIAFYDRIVVKALRDIEPYEEVTICYQEISTFFSEPDRRVIAEEWFLFTCNCEICKYERILNNAFFKCRYCGTGRVFILIKSEKTLMCLDCNTTFIFDDLVAEQNKIQILQNIYRTSYETKYAMQLLELCEKYYNPRHRIHMNVANVLCEQIMMNKGNVMDLLKYVLKGYESMRFFMPQHYLPVLCGKVNMFSFLLNHIQLIPVQKLSNQDYWDDLKKFEEELQRTKEDLLFYFPAEELSFFDFFTRVFTLFLISAKKKLPLYS